MRPDNANLYLYSVASLTGCADQLRLKPNVGVLAQLLVKRIGAHNIRRCSQLLSIHHGRHASVRLTFSDGRQLQAAAVVLAIPPHAIQRLAVTPYAMPAELQPKVAPVQYATGFVVRFSADFDTAANASGSFLLLGSPLFVVAQRTAAATLSGIAFHPSSGSDCCEDESAVKLTVLRLLYRRAPATVETVAWRATTWPQTVCRGRPSTFEWRRIVWSGTNAATAYRGLCSGAVQGGQRAALLVLLLLRPAVVDGADIARVQPASVVRRRGAGAWRRWCMAWNVSDAVRVAVCGPLMLYGVRLVWPRRAALAAAARVALLWLCENVISTLEKCLP